MLIYDAHIHYGVSAELQELVNNSPLKSRYLCYNAVQFENMDDYDCYMAKQGISKMAYVPFVFKELSILDENRRLLDYAKGRNEVFPYVLLDEDNVDFVRDNHAEIVGIKEHFILHITALNERRLAIFEDINRYNLNILLHTSGGSLRVDYIRNILHHFPHIKLHVAHLGRERPDDLAYIYNLLEQLKPYESVFFDTSTVRSTEALEKAVNIVGKERVLYGSDFPFFMGTRDENIIKTQVDHVLNTRLSEAEREHIFHLNFDRLITKG